MLKVKVILGSTREGRFGEQPAKWITEKAKQKGLDVELLDLRDFPLPFFKEAVTPSYKKEAYADPAVVQWTAKIKEADAFVVIAAEYNHSFTAVLKNAIDYVSPEWNKKSVGFVGYGTVGGARAIEQLRLVFAELQTVAVRTGVYMISPWTMLDEKGILDTSSFDAAGDMMLEQLVWWGEALKVARDKDAAANAVA